MLRRHRSSALAIALVAGLVAVTAPIGAASAKPLGWIITTGSAGEDAVKSVVAGRSGEVYAAGNTSGDLFGQSAIGGTDAFVVKYSATGTQLWARMFGSTSDEVVNSVALAPGGDLIVVGYTDGVVGVASFGTFDGFVARYSSSGKLKWIQQIGTSGEDYPTDVAVAPSGAIYVTGSTSGTYPGATPITSTYDSVLMKLDKFGKLVWSRQFGTTGAGTLNAVAIGQGERIYASGRRSDSLLGHTNAGDLDAMVTFFDKNGTQGATVFYGSASKDLLLGLAIAPNGDVVAAGTTSGVLVPPGPPGQFDVFAVRLTKDLSEIWLRQFGSPLGDVATRVAIDRSGTSHIAGYTVGSFGGPNQGGNDIFTVPVSAAGVVGAPRQYGTSGNDEFDDMALRPSNANGGALVIGGATQGSVFGFGHVGGYDALLFTAPS